MKYWLFYLFYENLLFLATFLSFSDNFFFLSILYFSKNFIQEGWYFTMVSVSIYWLPVFYYEF